MNAARRGFCLAIIVMLALACAATLPANGAAQRSQAALSSRIRLLVEPGFNGYYRDAAWLPVRIRISNTGPTFAGTLIIEDSGQQSSGLLPANRALYGRTVIMPREGVKDVTLYVPGVDLGSTITVSLITDSQGTLQRQAAISHVNSGALLVGVLSNNLSTSTQLRGLGGMLAGAELIQVPLSTAQLASDPRALASLDALVISNFTSSELSATQLGAVEAWVRGGGTLIEIGGPNAASVVGGLPAALQLVQPGAPLILHGLSSLAGLGGSEPRGTAVAAAGKLLQGTVVLDTRRLRRLDQPHAGAPALVVTRQFGLGTIVYSALDPTVEPLAGWSGLPTYWTLLAAQARAGAATATTALTSPSASTSQDVSLNAELDSVAPPSTTLFIALLAIYVFLLIPGNFVLLGRLRRRDLSWITLPALALLLVAGVFTASYTSQGREARASVINVLYLTSGGTQVSAQAYIGFYSPLAGDYALSSNGESSLASTVFQSDQSGFGSGLSDQAVIFAQDAGLARLPRMRMWSSRNVTFSSTVEYHGGLDGLLRAGADGHLSGTLTNRSSVAIRGMVLVPFSGAPVALGDVDPGHTLHINVPTGATQANPQPLSEIYATAAMRGPAPVKVGSSTLLAAIQVGMPQLVAAQLIADSSGSIPTAPNESVSDRFRHITQLLLDAGSPASFGMPIVIGWTGEAATSLTVNGSPANRRDTTLLVQAIPLTTGPGRFSINPGTLPARLSGADQDLQSGSGLTIPSNGTATFVAQLPAPASGYGHLQLSSLTVSAFSSGSGGELTSQTAQIYDWYTGAWTPVDISTGSAVVSNPQDYVNSSGLVRVRLHAQDASLSLNDADSGVALGATGSVL